MTDPTRRIAPPEIKPWLDPRVDVIVDHWLDEHPGEADPSWPTVAAKTLRALEAAGYRIVHPESTSVEERMAAMGMRQVSIGLQADAFYEEPFESVPHVDGRTYWTTP